MSHRVVSVRVYAFVFAALLVLLVLTVAVAYIPMGATWGAIAAMTIAVAKASLIMHTFMHLGNEDGLVRVFALSGFVWLVILFTLLLSDYFTRTDVIFA